MASNSRYGMRGLTHTLAVGAHEIVICGTLSGFSGPSRILVRKSRQMEARSSVVPLDAALGGMAAMMLEAM